MRIGDLRQAAQTKLQAEQEELQKAVQENLQNFKESLQESIKNVEITIENDITKLRERTKILSLTTTKIYIINFFFCLIILVSIAIASWGLISIITSKVKALNTEIETLTSEKEKLQQSLTNMTTFGLQLHEDKQGKFIVLPPDLQGELGWRTGSQNSIRLIEVK